MPGPDGARELAEMVGRVREVVPGDAPALKSPQAVVGVQRVRCAARLAICLLDYRNRAKTFAGSDLAPGGRGLARAKHGECGGERVELMRAVHPFPISRSIVSRTGEPRDARAIARRMPRAVPFTARITSPTAGVLYLAVFKG